MAQKRQVSLNDVAAAAGVSRSTAARALGGYGRVADTIQARVQSIARELGYRSNSLARSVSSGRSHTIGVVVSDIENVHFTRAVRGISDVAQERGYNVLLINTDEQIDQERQAVSTLLDQRVDGLIVAPSRGNTADHIQEAISMERPIVLLDRDLPALNNDWVGIDDYPAPRQLLSVAIDLGHRDLWLVAATTHSPADVDIIGSEPISSIAARIRAARDLERERYVSVRVITQALSRERSRRAIQDALATYTRPTAIIASYSEIMLSILEEARAQGLRVPEDISVASLDDARWMEATEPRITAVYRPSREMGQQAAAVLLDRITNGPGEPVRLELPTHLKLRESLAPAPDVDPVSVAERRDAAAPA